MLRFLKEIVKYASRVYVGAKWYLQFLYLFSFSNNGPKVTPLDTDSLGVSAILTPHADDELIGCSQILSIKSPHSICVYFHLYGNDISDDNVKKRDGEINGFVKSVGANLVDVHSDEDLLRVLECADSVFLPCPFDWHWQHREVFNSLIKVLDKLPDRIKYYYYYISVPFPESCILVGCPLTKGMQAKKWDSFKEFYLSQSFMPLTRFKLNERLDSRATKWYAAEVYMPRNKHQLIIDSTIEIDDKMIKSSIQSIIGIRKLSSSFNGLSK